MRPTQQISIFGLILSAIWSICILSPATYAQPRLLQTLPRPDGRVESITFSHDGQFLAVENWPHRLPPSGEVQLWKLDKPVLQRTIQLTDITKAAAFSPDKALFAVGCWPDGVQIWNLRTGKLLHTLKGSNLVDFSADGKTLLTVSVNTYISGPGSINIMWWNVQSGKLKNKTSIALKPNTYAQDISLSPDWKLLAIGFMKTTEGGPHSKKSLGGSAQLFNAQTGRLKQTWFQGKHNYQVTSITFSPDSKIIAAANYKDEMVLWDVATSQILKKFSESQAHIKDLSFSPDGKLLAMLVNGSIKIHDSKTGKQLHTLSIEKSEASCLSFSHDGTMLASDGKDANGKAVTYLWSLK